MILSKTTKEDHFLCDFTLISKKSLIQILQKYIFKCHFMGSILQIMRVTLPARVYEKIFGK